MNRGRTIQVLSAMRSGSSTWGVPSAAGAQAVGHRLLSTGGQSGTAVVGSGMNQLLRMYSSKVAKKDADVNEKNKDQEAKEEKKMDNLIYESDLENMDSDTMAVRLKYLEEEMASEKKRSTEENYINTRENPESTLPVQSATRTHNNPFNRYIKMLQRSRAATVSDSHTYDYMRDLVAKRLADRLLDVKRKFPRTMDISGGFSALSKYIPKNKIDELVMVDMSKEALYRDIINPNEKKPLRYHLRTEEGVDGPQECEDAVTPPTTGSEDISSDRDQVSSEEGDAKPDFKIKRINGNEQTPHLLDEEGTYDAVVSSLNMHWMNDTQAFLQSVKRTLKPDGMFLAAMYTGDTLFELRTSLQLSDLERYNALNPRVSPMAQSRDVAAQLQMAGFNLITVDVDEFQIYYPNIIELMKDLRYMGENAAVGPEGSNFLSRDTLIAAGAIYEQLYGLTAGAPSMGGSEAEGELTPVSEIDGPLEDDTEVILPATFQVTFMIGWRPHESQPKPLAPGSAKFSMKSLGQASQIAKQEKTRADNKRESLEAQETKKPLK